MRKKTIKSALPLMAMAALMIITSFNAEGQEAVDSKYNGVQIGAITYSYRDMRLDVEGTLKACVESGLSFSRFHLCTGHGWSGLSWCRPSLSD